MLKLREDLRTRQNDQKYEHQQNKDSQGNVLEIITILFSQTGKSEANPIYATLKSLDFETDVIKQYTDNKLIEKLNEIEKLKKI